MEYGVRSTVSGGISRQMVSVNSSTPTLRQRLGTLQHRVYRSIVEDLFQANFTYIAEAFLEDPAFSMNFSVMAFSAIVNPPATEKFFFKKVDWLS